MILPIIAFGNNILKTKAVPISADYPELKTLIINMRSEERRVGKECER
mgnify:CR=1 FL=1